MKKIFTLAFIFTLTLTAMYAQHKPLIKVNSDLAKIQEYVDHSVPLHTGFETVLPGVPGPQHPIFASSRTASEVVVGKTVYDLQSNASSDDRIVNFGNGDVAAVWTIGFDDAGSYPNRGTGYNSSMSHGIAWDATPTGRLESSVRTGWPSYVRTESGVEFIVAHTADNDLHYLTRTTGGGAWSENDIPNNIPGGLLWPRAATSGETIHVLAISTPPANGGMIYEGMDGHPLYYRSTDAGATWDKTDIILPGIDSATRVFDDGDSYAIDASGNTVAIVIFNDWNDIVVARSDDNGDSWTSTIAHDFPLEKYNIDDGYTVNDIPQDTSVQPDSLAIETCDGSGAILIDNDGLIHVFCGRMWVLDDNLTDGNSSYFPFTNGLFYWNELFGADSLQLITGVEDLNGNNVIDLTAGATSANIGLYFTSLSSMPYAGVDTDNNIYLAYSALMESDTFLNPIDNQHNRHVYVMASSDQGTTWNDPYDVINEDIVDPVGLQYYEGVFPSIARHVDWNVHLVYQRDLSAGLSVRGDMDPADENDIIYLGVGVEDLGITSTIVNTKSIEENVTQLSVSPNPVQNGHTQLNFELAENADVHVEIINALGQQVKHIDLGERNAGTQTHVLYTQNIEAGIYFVRMHAGDAGQTVKLIIE